MPAIGQAQAPARRPEHYLHASKAHPAQHLAG